MEDLSAGQDLQKAEKWQALTTMPLENKMKNAESYVTYGKSTALLKGSFELALDMPYVM